MELISSFVSSTASDAWTVIYNYSIHITATLLVLYVVQKAIYELYFSPLCDVAGPWYAVISNIWLTGHRLFFRQAMAVDALFEKYGPVVRVGPRRVAFNDAGAARDVYVDCNFDKSTVYQGFKMNGHDQSINILSGSVHALRRKAFAQHYTTANLALYGPEIDEHVVQSVNILRTIYGRRPVNCLELFPQLLIDVMCLISSGVRGEALATWAKTFSDETNVPDLLSVALSDMPAFCDMRGSFPTWMWNALCRIPNKRWNQFCQSESIVTQFVTARLEEIRKRVWAEEGKIQNGNGHVKVDKIPLLERFLRTSPTSPEKMIDEDIIAETMGQLLAGIDMTAMTLAYLFWELSRRDDIMTQLRAELDAAMPVSNGSGRAFPDIAVLNELPYLNGFIKEGMSNTHNSLRTHSAGPSLLERVVPEPAVDSWSKESTPDFDLLGIPLPPGTIIATQSWSLHRDPYIFPEPDLFNPDRWLNDAAERTMSGAMMAQQMIPFGLGSRMCGGMNLAQMMLRFVVAAVVRNFDVVAPAETTEKSMAMRELFVSAEFAGSVD
ncbi:hypothetical protein EWM64_g2866 [Hericium alpestre]|uniref:Cytochrome P450 n=1 Tax=Hericium alpestre TaxID=135208 RepID=A0A4Z0A3X9_9AGAM|nr:hypothetical protein EWM64_g2866 [Hericium alpestre]